jgi:hypothetical protein
MSNSGFSGEKIQVQNTKAISMYNVGDAKMKVLILAIDALEYNLVEKWDLKYLKQKIYGKIPLTEKYFPNWADEPYTPIIWHSFITGLSPEKHKIQQVEKYKHVPSSLVNIGRKLRLKKMAKRFGIKPSPLTSKDYSHTTIFDQIKPSIAIDVPTYNITEWKINKEDIKAVINYAEQKFAERKQRLFNAIQTEWKLIMAYFRILDLISHVYLPKRTSKLLSYYLKINKLAKKVRSVLPSKTLMLIVSDHGVEMQNEQEKHSKHAFWSINFKTNWKPHDITDFYHFLLKAEIKMNETKI